MAKQFDELIIPYPDFHMGDLIDPEQHDLNNGYIVNKVNELVDFTNEILGNVAGTSGAEQLSIKPIDVFTSNTIQLLIEEFVAKLRSAGVEDNGARFIGSLPLVNLTGLTVEEQLKALDALLSSAYVATKSIQDSAVTTPKITNGAITNQKLAPLSVSTSTVQDLAVTEQKVDNLAISTVKLKDASVTNQKMATNSVSTDNVQNNSITKAKMATNSVGTTQLENASVTNPKLATDSVGTSNIQNASITKAKMGVNSVGTAQLEDSSVNTMKLSPVSVGEHHIQNGSISTNKILANAVTGEKISDRTLTLRHLAPELINTIPETILSSKVLYLEDELSVAKYKVDEMEHEIDAIQEDVLDHSGQLVSLFDHASNTDVHTDALQKKYWGDAILEFQIFKSALLDGFDANQFIDALNTLDAFTVTGGYYNQVQTRIEV